MTLSACFLTRNDERGLARALRSVAGLADEVLVVDTASTDHTVPIAAGLGADVCPYPWDDDFAAARNFTVRRATGDWILWLTAAEELPAASHAAVRECVSRTEAFGYYVRVENMVRPDDQPDSFTETLDVRLFRRRPDLEFVGRLHPSFTPALAEALRREGQRVFPSEIRLRHHAYLSPLDEPKLRWTVRLLERELGDRPGQLHYLIEYGRTLLLLNDPKGHAVLAEAADLVRPARAAPAPPTRNVQVLLKYVLTAPPEQSLGRLSREEARELAARWFPDSPPLLWADAGDAYQAGDFTRAASQLEKLVALGRGGGYDRTTGFDPGMIGEDAVANLGACYWRLRQLEKAEACYRLLLPSRKYQAEASRNLALIRSALGQQGRFSFSFDVTHGPP